MKKVMIIAVLIYCLCSCHYRREKALSNCELCTQNELFKKIIPYFDEVSQWDAEHYGLYFFEENGKSYFTIWIDPDPPYYLVKNYMEHKGQFVCNYLKIDRYDLVFIRDKSSDVDIGIFKDCEKSFQDIRNIPKRKLGIEWDGSFYPATYQYKFANGRYRIKKLRNAIIDFMPDSIIEFEKWIKNKDENMK